MRRALGNPTTKAWLSGWDAATAGLPRTAKGRLMTAFIAASGNTTGYSMTRGCVHEPDRHEMARPEDHQYKVSLSCLEARRLQFALDGYRALIAELGRPLNTLEREAFRTVLRLRDEVYEARAAAQDKSIGP